MRGAGVKIRDASQQDRPCSSPAINRNIARVRARDIAQEHLKWR